MKRERLTWAAGRVASAPPATPGYGTEDQDHPAHQPDPAHEEFAKGDPSAWAEDPKKPPYPQGNPPSTPGYDVEDKDHPAHKEMPRVPKEAMSLTAMVVAKASKVMRLARAMLGRDAPVEVVEKQAFDFMDMPEPVLDATLQRMSGNPLLAEATPSEPIVANDDLDALLGLEAPKAASAEKTAEMDGIMAALDALKAQVAALKTGGQNAPGGSQNGANAPGKDEAAARAEGAATTQVQEVKTATQKAAKDFFASMDTNHDGFVSASEWLGPKDMFAAIDKAKCGYVTEEEVVAAMAPTACGEPMLADLDPEEQAMLAEMEAEACGAKAAKKAEDEAKPEEAKPEEPKPEEDEGKKAGLDDVVLEDEAAMFGLTGDPMGLSDEPLPVGEEDALLEAIFGGKVAEKKGDDEPKDDEPPAEVPEEDEGKKAGQTRTASQRPQPRKPNPGIKTVGQQTRTASEEVSDLSRLWPSDPDVSAVFGTTPRS